VLARVGVGSATVGCFRSFYSQLRQRFRYGQVDGSEWSMANGLAQGCPASPDLLNILYEAFHRWCLCCLRQFCGRPRFGGYVLGRYGVPYLLLFGVVSPLGLEGEPPEDAALEECRCGLACGVDDGWRSCDFIHTPSALWVWS